MGHNPQVSVIIPVYNGERYLAEAIESVLSQTYHPIEIIVVDDGSKDGSGAVARQFALIHYEFQNNSGAASARNRGVNLAKADFLAFLDADDLWSNERLSLQMAAFRADPQLDMVFGHIKQFHSPELDEGTRKQIRIPKEIIAGQHAGTMLIKKDAFLRVGPFRTDLEMGEFLDWYSRATELGLKSLMLPDVVMERRLHKTNQGIYKREHRAEYVRVLKSTLDRRRKNGT